MFSFIPPSRVRPAAKSVFQPLTPSDYLTTRREAAGFSQEQLARALVLLADHHEPLPRVPLTLEQGRNRYRRMLGIVRLLERRGSVAMDRKTIDAIAVVLPLDPTVYFALVGPNAQHPKVCRGCGCSGQDACHDHDDNICRWVTPALCSHCVSRGVAQVGVAA